MADSTSGYGKAGGWRFGGKKSSSDFLSSYTPESYNGGLLDQVGNANKKGAVDAAVEAKPIEGMLATGLLAPAGGNGGQLNTNLSDASWADVKAMRDQIGPDGKMAGFNNAYDTPSLKAALAGIGAVFGGPMAAGKLIPQAMNYSQQSLDGLRSFGGATTSPMFGGQFGTGTWQSQINDNAQARVARQQQSESEAKAIADYQASLAAQSGGMGGSYTIGSGPTQMNVYNGTGESDSGGGYGGRTGGGYGGL